MNKPIIDVHVKNGHVYEDVKNFMGLGFGGATGYVRFEQISGEALIPSVYNKNEIMKLVLWCDR